MEWITLILLILIVPPIILGEIALCKFLISKIKKQKGVDEKKEQKNEKSN